MVSRKPKRNGFKVVPPEPADALVVSARIPEPYAQRLRDLAAESNVPIGTIVRQMVAYVLDEVDAE